MIEYSNIIDEISEKVKGIPEENATIS